MGLRKWDFKMGLQTWCEKKRQWVPKKHALLCLIPICQYVPEILHFERFCMFNMRTPGGFDSPPLRFFFADNAKTAARSAAALGIAVHSSFPHIVSKFCPRVMSGQVTSPHHVTQPPRKFEAASKAHL